MTHTHAYNMGGRMRMKKKMQKFPYDEKKSL